MTDLEGRAFFRRGNTLVPSDFAAEEILSGIPEGKEILVTIRRPRHVEHHRWFFACLRRVVENSEVWKDEEELLDVLKIATGHTKPVQLWDGTIYRRPKSINFASQGQDAFQRFVNRALYVLAQMTGIDPTVLKAETQATQPPSRAKQKETAE